MGSRFPSHKLSSGLYVSGRPEQPKEKPPTMSSSAMPYTGGDIKTSGELGKMFDIPTDGSRRKSGPIGQPPTRTSSFGGAPNHSGPITSTSFNGRLGSAPSTKKSNSGPLNKHGELLRKVSGPQNASGIAVSRQNSGPLHPVLPATGLIISGPLNSSRILRNTSGQLDPTGSQKIHSVSAVNSQAVTNINMDDEYSFYSNFPKPVLWSIILLFVMGFIAGGFILGAVHNPVLMIVVVALFGAVGAALSWNAYWGKRAITSFIAAYPDADLRTAKDGEFVKVSGVITCGNVPLESSFHKIPRCVYTSTALYEYRGWNSKPANDSHRRFTWGIRSIERRVVDFYISDLQSGLRALVKTGYGAKVNAHVDDSAVIDMNPGNRDVPAEMVRWLGERNLSSDDRVMRVKEGYVKEGSAVSVMGVVHRNNNLVMILPPPHPVPTPCQWARCILPGTLYGIVLHSEDPSKLDVIPV